MELYALETNKNNFYAPTYSVEIANKDLLRNLFLTISSVEVDLKLKAAGHFSFTVENAFDWESREFVAHSEGKAINLMELFAFGTPVKIAFGYGERSKLSVLLQGTITQISTSFSEGGAPVLTVSGYDGLYPLTQGKDTHPWENDRDSKAVSDIAAKNGLTAQVVQTDPVKPRIDQSQESDFVFLEKLAKRNGAIFYMKGDKLYFGPRQNDRSDVLELTWGKDLLSFSPEVNLARQVTSVEVYGVSAEKGQLIVGRASRGDESGRDTRRESGADRVTKARGNKTVMQVRAAVHTQAEADSRARAILEERGEEFVKGSGESIGVPEIVPNVNIALTGLGNVFSKIYYVSESTHKIDGSGYRTTFKIEETSV
jgi:phage protein D